MNDIENQKDTLQSIEERIKKYSEKIKKDKKKFKELQDEIKTNKKNEIIENVNNFKNYLSKNKEREKLILSTLNDDELNLFKKFIDN